MLAAAASLGLPAGVLAAGGVLWLLFSQGKTLQENSEAWGKLSRGLRTRKGAATRLPTGIQAAVSGPSAGGRRFLVGFSYAGEERPAVAAMAERLAAQLSKGKVLFDKFHEAELARPDLDVYLPRLYRDQCELIVVVLSPDYPRKRWCGLEWRWIRQLILESDQARIMLIRLGDPGDLAELGILSGDGYLDATRRPAAEVAERIAERLDQLGMAPELAAAQPGSFPPGALAPAPLAPGGREQPLPAAPLALAGLAPHSHGRPWPLLAALGGGATLLAGLLLAPAWRSWQAQRLLEQGDRAFGAYNKLLDSAQFQRAADAWQQAASIAPRLPEGQARLGFLADVDGELDLAERAWRKAVALAPDPDPQASTYRNGLANVLIQQPRRRAEGLQILDGDSSYPRSAVDAAMLRWGDAAALPIALDAVSSPALIPALKAERGPGWGFKQGASLLLFDAIAERRCLLNAVRASTVHLRGRSSAVSPLEADDCQGIRSYVSALVCDRLLLAQPTNPRAAATRAWLPCPAERSQTRR